MEDLESILWIPAIICAIGVTVNIAKEYIDGFRMARKLKDMDDQWREPLDKIKRDTYAIERLTDSINKRYNI